MPFRDWIAILVGDAFTTGAEPSRVEVDEFHT
jgi:hypothetical protein